MATRRYKASPGQTKDQVVDEVGLPTISNVVELTIDLAATTINTFGGTRAITRDEVRQCVEKILERILEHKWLPA